MSVVFRGAMFRLAMIVLTTALSCEIGSAQELANRRTEGCRDFAARLTEVTLIRAFALALSEGWNMPILLFAYLVP